MKKKSILILAVILLSVVLIYFSKGLQKNVQDGLVKNNTVAGKNKSFADNIPNFIIYDETSGKEIYSAEVKYDGNNSLAEISKEVLKAADLSYRINASGYVSMIDDLYDYPTMPNKEEKEEWASCGWVFYINTTKASIGPKDYKPKETEIVTWKYWKDAIYEK